VSTLPTAAGPPRLTPHSLSASLPPAYLTELLNISCQEDRRMVTVSSLTTMASKVPSPETLYRLD
jgi:hypothetical protein